MDNFKKQKPLAGYAGYGGGGLGLAFGGASEKTYIDEVFSTLLWSGQTSGSGGTTRQMVNGIDLAGEGGLVWIKQRNQAYSTGHQLYDTVRSAGSEKEIDSSSTAIEGAGNIEQYGWLNSFNSNGFTTKGGSVDTDYINKTGVDYTAWTFRKAPGFFDIKTWDGDSNAGRQISHDLGCIPGMIMVKSYDGGTGDWMVYHREIGATHRLKLNSTTNSSTTSSWNDTTPTSTYVTLGSSTGVNATGRSYVGYFFAGGESTAATARSVDFDGSGDYLSLASTSDFAFGTGDFTIEFWVRPHATSGSDQLLDFRTDGGSASQSGKFMLLLKVRDELLFRGPSTNPDLGIPHSKYPVSPGVWSHIAVVRNSSTTTVYINGTAGGSASDTNNYTASTLLIGRSSQSSSNDFDGEISNLRIVKGTAVYTESFRPTYEPLTNITNTKLLCCNNSSTTGSTVTPGTITANGDPTASVGSPFDDPAAFIFGDSEDGNIIKTGSYVGNGSSSAPPEVYLGWEPQWVMIKHTTGQDWVMVDSMRGMFRGLSQTPHLRANANNEEQDTSYYRLDVSSGTGFAPFTTDNGLNYDGSTYVYIACRRPDGYVGKPPETGTSVYTQVYGTSNSDVPAFVSGFVTDMAINRQPAAIENWYIQSRMTGTGYMITNGTNAEATSSNNKWDYNNGWYAATNDQSAYQSWMWKRHAGFDVVNYTGNGVVGRPIPHSLNKIPEMIWVKARTQSSVRDWQVYHKGLNGGSSPEDYNLWINRNDYENDSSGRWNDTAPTSTHFTIGGVDLINESSYNYIAMLFASVDGISKVGYYTGDTNTEKTISDVGFQPRFILIRSASIAFDWHVFDTLRGMTGSGNDARLYLNTTAAQNSDDDYITALNSSGFTVGSPGQGLNGNGVRYIYYAHA